jgi:hypothetical protein
MDLGMFDKFCPSLKSRAQLDERRFDMSRSDKIVKDMLYLCIERMFGLTNGCRILERIFCRLATMILVRSTGKVGDHLKERED